MRTPISINVDIKSSLGSVAESLQLRSRSSSRAANSTLSTASELSNPSPVIDKTEPSQWTIGYSMPFSAVFEMKTSSVRHGAFL